MIVSYTITSNEKHWPWQHPPTLMWDLYCPGYVQCITSFNCMDTTKSKNVSKTTSIEKVDRHSCSVCGIPASFISLLLSSLHSTRGQRLSQCWDGCQKTYRGRSARWAAAGWAQSSFWVGCCLLRSRGSEWTTWRGVLGRGGNEGLRRLRVQAWEGVWGALKSYLCNLHPHCTGSTPWT